MGINITTAIDSLVELIKNKKKLTLDQASTELGIPPNIINEWATFLEEEGVLQIEYKFTTPYLSTKEKSFPLKEENLKQRLDLASRKLEFMLTTLSKFKIEIKEKINDIEDVRKLMKDYKGKVTKEFVFAQKFILEYEINDGIKIIKKIKMITPEAMEAIEKKIVDLENKKVIFEKNYSSI
jgi:hypothetical protein